MKKLLFLGACLVALASGSARAQTGGPEVAVVRTRENALGGDLVVVRPTGAPERIDLPSNLTKAAEAMRQLVTKLYQEGYTLKSTYSAEGSGTTTLIFVKEK